MPKVDMSSKAVTTRLKRASQLRRLCLSLGAAKLEEVGSEKKKIKSSATRNLRSNKREAK